MVAGLVSCLLWFGVCRGGVCVWGNVGGKVWCWKFAWVGSGLGCVSRHLNRFVVLSVPASGSQCSKNVIHSNREGRSCRAGGCCLHG